jgi:hypothetical protein
MVTGSNGIAERGARMARIKGWKEGVEGKATRVAGVVCTTEQVGGRQLQCDESTAPCDIHSQRQYHQSCLLVEIVESMQGQRRWRQLLQPNQHHIFGTTILQQLVSSTKRTTSTRHGLSRTAASPSSPSSPFAISASSSP